MRITRRRVLRPCVDRGPLPLLGCKTAQATRAHAGARAGNTLRAVTPLRVHVLPG
jgi:hypothetical protein